LPQQYDSSNPGSPFYLAPATADQTLSIKLTSPDQLKLFLGSGKVSLPVEASAFSSFVSTSGNGWGKVRTSAAANVKVSYEYHSVVPSPQGQLIPEPGAVALWGLG